MEWPGTARQAALWMALLMIQFKIRIEICEIIDLSYFFQNYFGNYLTMNLNARFSILIKETEILLY